MRLFASLICTAALGLAVPGYAQQSDTSDLSLGQPAGEPRPGEMYVKEETGDWSVRCVKQAEGKEPCHLFQLMFQANGNAVAEIQLFALPPGQQAVAGANIMTPLETLLQRQLTISIDGQTGKIYPYSFCNKEGCMARLGFTAADLLAFERGSVATLTIFALAAPDQPIQAQLSLNGFIKGYDRLLEGL